MPKLKMARKSTSIDMTAMCDVAFLLLTFFMLATKFKPDEPVVVQTPNSISEIPIPDANVMLITIDKGGRIFFSIDNQKVRRELITEISNQNNLGLDAAQINNFALGSSIGVSFSQLKQYLSADGATQKAFDKETKGIPTDTAMTRDNELGQWIRNARQISANLLNEDKLRICIKADEGVMYPDYKNVITTLSLLKVFKFNLITGLKAVPEGTAAWEQRFASSKTN